MQVVERAKREDLNNVLRYKACFIRNSRGEVVIDRAFNTSALLEVYMGKAQDDLVLWSPDQPGLLKISLPGLGSSPSTRSRRPTPPCRPFLSGLRPACPCLEDPFFSFSFLGVLCLSDLQQWGKD